MPELAPAGRDERARCSTPRPSPRRSCVGRAHARRAAARGGNGRAPSRRSPAAPPRGRGTGRRERGTPELGGIARRTIGSSDRRLGWTARTPALARREFPALRPSWVVSSSTLRTVAGPVSGYRSRVRHTRQDDLRVRVHLVSCSPSGFRPRTFEAVPTPRPLVILRRHMGPGGDLQRVDRCTALRACWAVLPVRGSWPAGQVLPSGRVRAAHPSRRYPGEQQAACL